MRPLSTKTQRILFGCGVLLGIGLLIAMWWKNREPRFEAKRLTVWLEQLPPVGAESTTDDMNVASEALRKHHAIVLPALLKMVDAEDFIVTQAFRKLLAKQQLINVQFRDPAISRGLAYRGLWTLGPIAEGTLPNLERRLFDPQVVSILGNIGPKGLPLLERCSTNEWWLIRAMALTGFEVNLTNVDHVMPFLVRFINTEPEFTTKVWAARILATTRQEESLVVPLLLEGMTYGLGEYVRDSDGFRSEAARALANYPVHAVRHLAEIKKLAEAERNTLHLSGARDALKIIAPELVSKD